MAKKKGILTEFKQFLLRGNVVDLAVAVVIGTAFGAVVKALVSDILTPLIGLDGVRRNIIPYVPPWDPFAVLPPEPAGAQRQGIATLATTCC